MSFIRRIVEPGPALIGGASGTLLRSSNLRVWESFSNGGAEIAEWNGEQSVALLGYDNNYANEKTATFTTSRDVGPTASGVCSPARLSVDECLWYDGYFLTEGFNGHVVDLQQEFTDPGIYGTGDGQEKPSNVHILFGIWFEYDGPLDPHIDGSRTWHGVAEIGVGQGDLLRIEDLEEGSDTWLFTGRNKQANGVPPPESTDWCGTGGQKPQAVWYEMTTRRRPRIRISIIPPGGAGAIPDVHGSPNGLRYYVQVYVVEGCDGITGIELVKGDTLPAVGPAGIVRLGRSNLTW